jgi:hypothetical protein
MVIDTPFKYYGNFNTIGFNSILMNNDFDWDEWDFRRKRFHMLYQTQTIPLLFDETWHFTHVQKHKHYSLFETEIDKLTNHFKSVIFNGDGYFLSALLVRLLSGNDIKHHIDNSIHYQTSLFTRIHIPISTNEKCIFTVGDESKNLKTGELWQINYTQMYHSVTNQGDTDRIHLILDWVQTNK